MKYTREYCFGGFDGKANEDDFVVGYQAENGRYIKVAFSIANNRNAGYYVFNSREDAEKYCFDYLRSFCALKAAKAFAEDLK